MNIKKGISREDSELISAIAIRAVSHRLNRRSGLELLADLRIAHKVYNLRLMELLRSDEFNFTHDIIGIQNHVNREDGTMDNLFLPRFAGR